LNKLIALTALLEKRHQALLATLTVTLAKLAATNH
jgi:hypothetical protein